MVGENFLDGETVLITCSCIFYVNNKQKINDIKSSTRNQKQPSASVLQGFRKINWQMVVFSSLLKEKTCAKFLPGNFPRLFEQFSHRKAAKSFCWNNTTFLLQWGVSEFILKKPLQIIYRQKNFNTFLIVFWLTSIVTNYKSCFHTMSKTFHVKVNITSFWIKTNSFAQHTQPAHTCPKSAIKKLEQFPRKFCTIFTVDFEQKSA